MKRTFQKYFKEAKPATEEAGATVRLPDRVPGGDQGGELPVSQAHYRGVVPDQRPCLAPIPAPQYRGHTR